MINHLADDPGELARRHVVAILVHIPELDEDLGPGLRVSAAIQSRELARLDLGDMVSGLHFPPIIAEDQGAILKAPERIEELADGNIFRVGDAGRRADVALDRHLRYPLIRYL